MVKGFIRTLEAFIAIAFSFMALVYLFPATQESAKEVPSVLPNLLHDSQFRACVIADNKTCVEGIVRPLLPSSESFLVNLTTDASVAPAGLPDSRVDTETLFIAGNDSLLQPRIVRLYRWVS
ncbi:MAG: hypothetical protein V1735_03025 [Nanoarchaeota archaeon]